LIASRFEDMRRFRQDLEKKVAKAAEDGIRKKLGPNLTARLKVKYDGQSQIELTGPDRFVEEAQKRLS
jgi:hypothetical protein